MRGRDDINICDSRLRRRRSRRLRGLAVDRVDPPDNLVFSLRRFFVFGRGDGGHLFLLIYNSPEGIDIDLDCISSVDPPDNLVFNRGRCFLTVDFYVC